MPERHRPLFSLRGAATSGIAFGTFLVGRGAIGYFGGLKPSAFQALLAVFGAVCLGLGIWVVRRGDRAKGDGPFE